ncbi:MAG: hypothetical protein ACXAC2_00105 [Candidatus Kariarchaeaceae archaeon]|jgi:hypothetical protein
MVDLRIRQEGQIKRVSQALTESVESDLVNGLKAHYVDISTEQMVALFNDLKTEQGITGTTISASFPEYQAGEGQEIEANMIVPYIAITINIGPSMELGVGRRVRDSEDGEVFGFTQFINIEFDCHGSSQLVADRLAGWITTSLQRYKMSRLRQKGFIDVRQLYSRPARGYSPSAAWDFQWKFYPFRVFRHLIYVETSFEVIWVEKFASQGTITQILFDAESDFIADLSMGFSMKHLLAEELRLGYHEVLY